MPKPKSFRELEFSDQVRRARAKATDIVLFGPQPNLNSWPGTDDEFLTSYVESLVGHDGPLSCVADEKRAIGRWEDSLAGAYALGIAVGQLLSPAVFAKTRGLKGE